MNRDCPIAFFLTWVTYGTWLPGDRRGWVEYRHGWSLPNRDLEFACEGRCKESAVRLNKAQRSGVEHQIAETCTFRGWYLHAVNCRTNHIHVAVTANETSPKKLRIDLKAYATRYLNREYCKRMHWWAERGSIRWIFREVDLESVILYVTKGQEGNRRGI